MRPQVFFVLLKNGYIFFHRKRSKTKIASLDRCVSQLSNDAIFVFEQLLLKKL